MAQSNRLLPRSSRRVRYRSVTAHIEALLHLTYVGLAFSFYHPVRLLVMHLVFLHFAGTT